MGQENNIPDAQHDFKTLGFGSRHDGYGRIAIGCGVSSYKGGTRSRRNGIKVGFIVGLAFAGPVGVLGAQSKSQCTSSRHKRRRYRQSKRCHERETHIEERVVLHQNKELRKTAVIVGKGEALNVCLRRIKEEQELFNDRLG